MKKIAYFSLLLIILVIGISIGVLVTKNKINEIQESRSITIPVVGVTDKGTGIVGTLTATEKQGTGLVLVNINNILANYDTQYSARTAAHVASNYTNISLDNLDITYSIKTNAELIAGTSAGSAFTVSTIALLQNKSINSTIAITGTINEDSSISEIGGMKEKADAVKNSGMKLFLVPKGNLKGTTSREKDCINTGNAFYCEINYVEKVNETIYGIPVKEISHIKEAMEYFYNEKE